MAWLRRIWNTLRPGSLHRELEEELHLHLDLRTGDLERSGITPDAARAQASRQFGNLTFEKERMRDLNLTGWLQTILKDTHYAFRQFARNPGFTTVAVLSLALGIGANTAIFSILNAALLKALPVHNPQELVMLTNPDATGTTVGMETGQDRSLLTYPEFAALRDGATTVSGMCAAQASTPRLSVRIAGGTEEAVRGRLVSEGYFSLFGVEPAIGRFFKEEDAAGPGHDPYTVIGYQYWQRRFGGNSSVLGATIRVRRTAFTVIGVAGQGFHGENVSAEPDLWLPMMMQPLVDPGRDWLHENMAQSIDKAMWLHVFARLKRGVTVDQAQAEMSVLFRHFMEAGYPLTMSPETRKKAIDQRLKVRDASTGAFGGRNEFSKQMLLLLVAAGLVLLISCANVANLLLARAAARYREVGVRLSMGAAKGRLVRQFLTESLILSALGGIAGALFAAVVSRILVKLLSTPRVPLEFAPGFDLTVFAFTAGVTLLTGVLFGLAPAFRATRIDINESLKETSRGVTGGGRRLTLAKALVSGQVALSLLLVIDSGLFVRTLWNLQSVGVGYQKQNLLLVPMSAEATRYKDVRLAKYFHEIADRLHTVPGVQAVTWSVNGLFSRSDEGDEIEVEGFTPANAGARPSSQYDEIGPGYFSTLGIPLLLGREIGEQDGAASPHVCVINEAFAKKFFAGRNPIGKRVTDVYGDKRFNMEVIGVAGNARDHGLRGDVPPRFYAVLDQGVDGVAAFAQFELRSAGDPMQIANAVRKTILDMSPDVSIATMRPLTELIDLSNAQPRLMAQLSIAFGILALVLAATGLYGVLSYGVARRTNEIGIRMALGSGKRRVIGMILRETTALVLIGVVAGTAATAASMQFIASRLYGLSAMDPLTIAVAIGVLGSVALVAGYVPAARAARVNPVNALRHE